MSSRSIFMRSFTVLLLAATVSLYAVTPTYSIDAHVIASGSAVRAQSPCFRMTSTIGEPVAGFSSSASYSLNGGFLVLANTTPGDDIFFDSFEGCAP